MNAESRPAKAALGNARSGTSSTVDSTARPRPVTLIGPKLYHSLIAHGYAITGVCRACGAPLTNRKSVAAGIGPVCGRQVSRNG